LIEKGALTLTNLINKNRNVSLLPPATDALPMPLPSKPVYSVKQQK
jgi:hypothetical protein